MLIFIHDSEVEVLQKDFQMIVLATLKCSVFYFPAEFLGQFPSPRYCVGHREGVSFLPNDHSEYL